MTTDDFYMHPPFTEQELVEEIEEELSIRFIKLTNGEDIICSIVQEMETDDYIYVGYPMKLDEFFDEIEGTVEYLFIPWIPFAAEETAIPVAKTALVTCTEVTELMEMTYLNKLVELDDLEEEAVAEAPSTNSAERIPELHTWKWSSTKEADEACKPAIGTETEAESVLI